MQQCDVVTSGDDVRAGVAPVHPTSLQQLNQRLTLEAMPQQQHGITSTEDDFRASLTPAEAQYVDEIQQLWAENAYGLLTRVQFNTTAAIIENHAIALHIPLARSIQIKNRAAFFSDERHELENQNTQVRYREELLALVERYKHREFHRRDFKDRCYSIYWRGKRDLLTDNQARTITFSVARKMHVRNHQQLWYYCKTNHTIAAIRNLHFHQHL